MRSTGRRGGPGAGRLLLAAMLIASLVLAGVAEAGRLRIGVYPQNPPKSFVDERGQLAGFDIDFARALCRQIGFECELVPSDWSELIPGLIAHRFDAVVASVSITDARRERIAFTRPYYASPARFVARKGRFPDLDPEALEGVRLGVRRDTTFDDYATEHLGERVEIYRYTTQPDALADLVLGRIDLVLGDHIVIDKNFLETAPGEDFTFVGPPVADPHWFGDGIGVALAKGDSALQRLLDEAVADMHANGTFERIQRRWFGYEVRDLTAVLQARQRRAEE